MSMIALIEERISESEYFKSFKFDPKALLKAYLIDQEENCAFNELDDGYNPALFDAMRKEFGDINVRSADGEHMATWMCLADNVKKWINQSIADEIEM